MCTCLRACAAGLLVDTSRNFLPMRSLLATVDGLAASRLSVLHLHILDAQSFPLRVPQFPELHERGIRVPVHVHVRACGHACACVHACLHVHACARACSVVFAVCVAWHLCLRIDSFYDSPGRSGAHQPDILDERPCPAPQICCTACRACDD